MGRGAQFVGNRALLLEERRHAETAGGFVDSTGRGKENCGDGRTGPRQYVSAGADERLQAGAIADSSEGPRREPVETVRLKKCFGDAAGYGSRSWQRGGAVHGALRPSGNRSEFARRQDLQRRERQCDRVRHPAGTGTSVGGDAGGGAAVDFVCVGHGGGAGTVGIRVFGKTFAGAAGKNYGGLEF